MANRIFDRALAMEKQIVQLFGSVVIGSAGAVGTTKGLGIASVVHNGTGNYTIVLNDSFNRYMGGFSGFVNNSTGSGIFKVEVKHDPQTVQSYFQTSKSIDVQMYNASEAATDPAAGSVWSFSVYARQSSVGPN